MKALKAITLTMHALCFFLALLVTIHEIQAVDYNVTISVKSSSTPGGARFRDQIGVQYATQTLDSATKFIWGLFQQTNNPADRKNVQKVSLIVVVECAGDVPANTNLNDNIIHLSAKYINSYNGDLKNEITGILYHETTHVWQWFGNNQNQAPVGLTEGIADYVRLKSNYITSSWAKPGEGDKWDSGYQVTARFLEYCESLRSGFVADLNKMLRNGYSDQFFVQLLGKTPGQLFTDYKAKYANIA